jgi:hypothetical protein
MRAVVLSVALPRVRITRGRSRTCARTSPGNARRWAVSISPSNAGIGGFRAIGKRGSIAIEGAGGLRSVRYEFASSYHNCETQATIVANRGVVEARARAELWLSPWITAGATLGTNVLERDDWMAGLYLGVHSRAFADGR